MAKNSVLFKRNIQKVGSKSPVISGKDSSQVFVGKMRDMQRRTAAEKQSSRSQRDFTAYFRSSTKMTEPIIGVTSHNSYGRIAAQKNPIHLYALTSALGRKPTAGVTSVEYCQDPDTYCKCDSYKSELCPSCDLLNSSENHDNRIKFQRLEKCTPQSQIFIVKKCTSRTPAMLTGFKDNIIRFNDQCTMTVAVTDTCIGTPSPLRHVSQASTTTSDIAVKGTQENIILHNNPPGQTRKTPILKKQKYKYSEYQTYSEEYSNHSPCTSEVEESQSSRAYAIHPPHRRQRPQIQSDELEFESLHDKFFKGRIRRQCLEQRCIRKILYNEGITDIITQQYPVTPLNDPHVPVKSNYSKSCMRFKNSLDEESNSVPYSHRSDSRYHANCKSSRSKHFMSEQAELRHLQSSAAVMRSFLGKQQKSHHAPAIQLPKRLLTSDRDIEAFVDGSHERLHVVPRGVRN